MRTRSMCDWANKTSNFLSNRALWPWCCAMRCRIEYNGVAGRLSVYALCKKALNLYLLFKSIGWHLLSRHTHESICCYVIIDGKMCVCWAHGSEHSSLCVCVCVCVESVWRRIRHQAFISKSINQQFRSDLDFLRLSLHIITLTRTPHTLRWFPKVFFCCRIWVRKK